MSGRLRFFLTWAMFLLLFFIFEIYLFMHQGDKKRDRNLLLNQYYTLRQTDMNAAKKALMVLHEQYPTDPKALQELGYWYLHAGDVTNAIKYFNLALSYQSNDIKSLSELVKLYLYTNQQEEAIALLKKMKQINNPIIQVAVQNLLNQMPISIQKRANTNEEKSDTNESLIATLAYLVSMIPSTHSYSPLPAPTNNVMTKIAASEQPKTAKQNVSSQMTTTKTKTKTKTTTERDKLLNQFYDNKKKNKKEAWKAIKKLLERCPKDVQALKEAGFFALSEKEKAAAFDYLNRAYLLTSDPALAMQLGYLLDGEGLKKYAFHYFKLATRNPKQKERYKAEIALTNLRGAQTKILPNPYFFDLFYNPFHFSRFNLIVSPIVAHLGRTINNKYQWQIYASYHRTFDNRSGISDALPQIYQDSTSIYALGSQITPFKRLPATLFLEVGKARNLVPSIKPHWRGDLRGGLAYYTEWGREARYTFQPVFPFKYVADLYGDAIYYSRYQNWIGTIRWRPGIELLRYLAASLDLYFRGFLIEDTQREFFNNLFEYGLGAVFIPTDRYNIAFRYEFTEGYYLPASGASANPYGAKYHNNVIEIDFFIRL